MLNRLAAVLFAVVFVIVATSCGVGEEKKEVESPQLLEESLKTPTPTLSAFEAVLSPHPWPMPRYNTQHTGRSPFVGPVELPMLKWSFSPEGCFIGNPFVPFVAANGTVYYAWLCRPGQLYAVKPDGSVKWIYEAEAEVSVASIGTDGTIYARGSGYQGIYGVLYAINPDGTLKWKYDTEIDVLLIDANGTIFGEAGGLLHIISSDGRLKDSITPPRDDMLYSSMSMGVDGTIYSGFERLYAWSADGTVKWMYDTGGNIYSPPVIGDNGTIYIISERARLHAINSDGTMKWTTALPGVGDDPPAIGADGTVYLNSEAGALFALNPKDGTPKWVYETRAAIYDSPTIGGDGTIYVGASNYRLYAINPDGTLRWSYVGDSVPRGIVVGTDSTIYYSSEGGQYANAIGPID